MNVHPITLLAAATLVLLSACSTEPQRPTTSAPVTTASPSAAPAAPSGSTSPSAAPATAVTTVTLPPYLDPANPLARERSVFFDFDDFSIKPEYTGLVERHGRYLAGQAAVSIKLEGHADERGSPEYNLALGQKRAEAVLRALRLQGVRVAQMEAVSWGEERPRAAGHDEASWAQNRRVDLTYPAR
jgi:peptidoglycan-associated lipoprotein